MIHISRLVAAVSVLSLLAVGFIGGVVYNPVVIAPLAYWHAKQQSDAEATTPVREAVYQDVCPAYRDTSTWMRWTDGKFRSLSWCEDYLDRLPAAH